MNPQAKPTPQQTLPPALLGILLLLLARPGLAGSDTWLANPGSGDWNTAANWVGATVPNSAADAAIFDSSSITNLSISANTRIDSIVFNAGASAYTIVATPTFELAISGAGIINNSGNTQSFAAPVDGAGGFGLITFTNSATAGNNTAFTVYGGSATGSSGGDIEFRDSSNAGGATFTLNGSTGGNGGGIVGFSDTTSAANGTFVVYGASPGGGYGTGYLQFHGSATAANGNFTNYGDRGGGNTFFYNSSTAGNSTINNISATLTGSGGGRTSFTDTATAGDATITNHGGPGSTIYNGDTVFYGGSSVGNATIINNAGTASGALGGKATFYTSSTTGNGIFINNGGTVTGAHGGTTWFYGSSGAGTGTFTNNGGTAANTRGGWTEFWENSTAGNSDFTNHGGTENTAGGGLVKFYSNATAGSSTFTNCAGTVNGANGGAVVFGDSSSAQNSTFINYGSDVSGASAGSTQFFTNSVAANATIINHGGTTSGANGADAPFYDSTSAGNSTITNNGGTASGALGGITKFMGSATAGNATITQNGGAVSGALGGTTQFQDTATAGNATLIATGGVGNGGSIQFLSTATGGTARVKVYDNGNLDISQHNTGVSIGSLEGNGNAFLGARTLTVGANNLNTSFSGVLQDGGVGGGTAGKLTKTGSGTLTLTGANTYTGTTTVNGGTLVIDTVSNASVLSASAPLALGGGTFQLKGNSGIQSQTVNGLTLSVNGGASVVQVNNLGTSTTLNLGNITRAVSGGTVDFTANANGVIKTTKTNVNGILGGWATVDGGSALATKNSSNEIVAYTGYTALDAQAGGANPTVNDGTALNYGINAAGTSGSVAIAAATTNINTLTQNFDTAATIDTAGKALRVGVAGGFFISPNKAALTIGTAPDSGVVMAGGSATNVAGELFLANFSDNALTVNSTVTNNGTGTVRTIKTGNGLVVLNGTNTFTAGTTINAGTLRAGNISALGAATSTLRINSGTLDLATDTSVNAWNTTVASSTTILSNKATASSTGITHTLGTLAIGGQTLSINAGGNVAADSNFGVTFGTTTLSGNPTFDVANNGAGTGTLTLVRLVTSGARTLTKTGGGTLVFDFGATGPSVTTGTSIVVNNGIAQVNKTNALGSNASTPGVTVNATNAGSTAAFNLNNVSQRVASLTFGGAGATSTSTNNVATGTGTLTLGGNITYDAAGNPLASTLSGILALGADRTFFVGDSSNAPADLTISANISGNTTSGIPSITKTGPGTLVLTGTNSFTRGVGINEGVLVVGTLPSASGNSTIGTAGVQFGGGTLRYTGGTVTTSRAFVVNTGGGEIDLTQNGATLTISSAFNGPEGGLLADALVKTGAGTLALTGNNNNADLSIIVDSGTLQLAKSSSATQHAIGYHLQVNAGGTAQLGGTGGDQIQNDAYVAVNTGGVLDLNGRSETFDGLSGGGSISNTGTADSTLTVGARNHLAGATTFSGTISDGATRKVSLTKIGRGTQILTGTNTYTGPTLIDEGKLVINGNSSAATGAVTVSDGGTLGGSGTIGGATTVNSGGTLSPGNSPGTLTFDSNLTLSLGSTVVFEGGDLIQVNGILDLDDWTLTLESGLQDGGSMTLFTFGSLAASPDLMPTFDLTSLGFTPTSSLSLSTTGSSIVLHGVSVVPEPAAPALLGLGFSTLLLFRRRRTELNARDETARRFSTLPETL